MWDINISEGRAHLPMATVSSDGRSLLQHHADPKEDKEAGRDNLIDQLQHPEDSSSHS